MKPLPCIPVMLLALSVVFTSCHSNEDKPPIDKEPKLKEETVSYKLDSSNRNNFLVYDENKEGKRPVVLVIHEWWGLNEYAKMRARELAKLGYFAIAVDMYGDNKTGDDPAAAEKLAMPFYMKPELARPIFDSAIARLKAYSHADTGKIAAIGYCFGGAQVLNLAKMGKDLKAVVSFHGNLNVVPANKELLKAEILVCHGNADPFVPQAEVDQFKKQMDSIGAKYVFKGYDSATHAFTNPAATAMGEKFKLPIKYNGKADTASWKDMKEFFERVLR